MSEQILEKPTNILLVRCADRVAGAFLAPNVTNVDQLLRSARSETAYVHAYLIAGQASLEIPGAIQLKCINGLHPSNYLKRLIDQLRGQWFSKETEGINLDIYTLNEMMRDLKKELTSRRDETQAQDLVEQ